MGLTAEGLVGLGRVTALAPDPRGAGLAVQVQRVDPERAKYISDIWWVPLAGGEAECLLDGATDDAAPRFRADGALGFLSDRGSLDDEGKPEADAVKQVWLRSGDGTLEQITDEPNGVSGFRFAGDRLVVVTSVVAGIPHEEQREAREERKKKGPSILRYGQMPVRHWDHWLAEGAPHFAVHDAAGRRDLTPGADREYRETSWDVGDEVLVAARVRDGVARLSVNVLDVIDLATGDTRAMLESEDGWFGELVLSDDGRRVAMVRGRWEPGVCFRHRLTVVDLATGAQRDLAQDLDLWLTPAAWLGDDTLVCTADDDGYVRIYLVDVATGEATAATTDGSHQGLEVAGGRVVGIRHGLLQPPEPFVLEAAGPRLLANLSGVTAAELGQIAKVERFDVAATDGARVQSWLVTPAAGSDRAVLWIHGGPIGAWGDGWHWRWNAVVMVERGYAIAMPNPRGSTGFGQAFIEGIWGNVWGDQCYADVMAIADALDARFGWVAAMGGSFGGYMTNWIGTQTDRFACLVTHASVFDYRIFQPTTDRPAYWNHMVGMTAWDGDPSFERYSPAAHTTTWSTPTLVIHGDKDYRVPITEGLALFEALQLRGVPSELVVFPDENHWILKPRNIAAWYGAVEDWLGRHG